MNEPKRQKLPPGLWVVATPIGNLSDLTDRARWALGEASAVLCEDTRRTATLLSALGISAKTERLDAHASDARIEAIVERLGAGESFALVTDAGTPGISDPGSRLVAAAARADVRVTPVPGPAAVTAMLSIAGFERPEFGFHGFFPRKATERKHATRRAKAAGGVHVWYESPERIEECLAAFEADSPDAPCVAAKELTKLHERVFRGSCAEVRERVASELAKEGARGEWCLCVDFGIVAGEAERGDSSEWVKALHCLSHFEGSARVSASEAAKQVSQHFGVAKNLAYEKALEIFGKKITRGD